MAGEQQFLPPALPEVIPRTRLLELLDGFRDRRLIIINAPAGQGKITLLAQYLALRRHRAVWRNLTEDDGDPARFLSALARALGTLFPGHGIEALRTPMQTTLPLDQDVAMKHWFGHLWALIPEPCWIVLDDYHRLARRSPVHRIIEILLDGMPPGFSLALLSRIPPPLRLASLLAKRQVAELTTQDLALSQEETGQLAELLLRRPLTAGESDSLWKNCEGWIAGVILMTHTLHARETQGPVFPSAGSSAGPVPGRELLFDYLAEEVFKKLSPSTQSLLCRTSILESVPVTLARILSRNPRARTILSGLQRDNLLTAALDAGGALFRYHPLFREFLRERLKTSLSAPRRVGLYRTSAGYYERQGNPEEAVRLLLEAGKRTPALRLIEKNGLRLFRQGRKHLARMDPGAAGSVEEHPSPPALLPGAGIDGRGHPGREKAAVQGLERFPKGRRPRKPGLLRGHAHRGPDAPPGRVHRDAFPEPDRRPPPRADGPVEIHLGPPRVSAFPAGMELDSDAVA